MLFNPSELSRAILSESSVGSIDYNEYMVSNIFYNDFIKYETTHNAVKNNKNFHFNLHGYRSPEFINNPDFLFSGCSITEGIGLDVDQIWYELLIKKVGGTHASVAYAGDSVVGQVLKIFSYIKNFGPPKHIICLFPNFDRILIYNNKSLLGSKMFFKNYNENYHKKIMSDNNSSIEKKQYVSSLFKSSSDIYDTEGRNKYFKIPLYANEVITQEISHMYSAQMINILSQYCKSLGIKFIWSTWDFPSAQIINKIKNNDYFAEYVDVESETWDYDYDKKIVNYTKDDVIINCHQEFSSYPEFNFASDREMGIEHSHHGFHQQIHYYENFLSALELK